MVEEVDSGVIEVGPGTNRRGEGSFGVESFTHARTYTYVHTYTHKRPQCTK